MNLSESQRAMIDSHCGKYKICQGCPFVNGKCVAPVGDSRFDNWVQSMIKAIAEQE